ncbi:MAG: rhodanese-like domain-containing protein [Thermodesulfobacteriota bacterium]
MQQGYTNVYRFTGGNAEWRSFNYPLARTDRYKKYKVKKLPPKDVAELLKGQPDILILDVRPEKFSKGPQFIAGAINLPLLNITERAKELPRETPIVITDWTMRQSPLAAKYLLAHGFDVVGVMKGGIIRWEAEGYPVEIRTPKGN